MVIHKFFNNGYDLTEDYARGRGRSLLAVSFTGLEHRLPGLASLFYRSLLGLLALLICSVLTWSDSKAQVISVSELALEASTPSSSPARYGSEAFSPIAGLHAKADKIIVYKSLRRLDLMRDGKVWRSYRVALGRRPEGHKRWENDGRTPEGRYTIDWRNPASRFHRSLHISYPGPEDLAHATKAGLTPGELIMIHGLPNDSDAAEVGHPSRDWTQGCIAVTNEEIEEIWHLVDDGTPIEIVP